jgi:hypothetical protein
MGLNWTAFFKQVSLHAGVFVFFRCTFFKRKYALRVAGLFMRRSGFEYIFIRLFPSNVRNTREGHHYKKKTGRHLELILYEYKISIGV